MIKYRERREGNSFNLNCPGEKLQVAGQLSRVEYNKGTGAFVEKRIGDHTVQFAFTVASRSCSQQKDHVTGYRKRSNWRRRCSVDRETTAMLLIKEQIAKIDQVGGRKLLVAFYTVTEKWTTLMTPFCMCFHLSQYPI